MFLKYYYPIITLCLIAFSPTNTSAGEVISREEIRYYEVKGSSVTELKKNLGDNGTPYMRHVKAEHFWGFTHRTIHKLNKCTEIIITNHIDMPRWIGRDDASPLLRYKWDRMVRQLLKHERGHSAINIRAANEHLAAKCTNKDAIKQRRTDRNAGYDKWTRHGGLTGVVLF